MAEFVYRLPRLNLPKTAFVFTTCGLYTGNSLRILIKQLLEKNIVAGGYVEIRGPASDGALMFPSWLSLMFNYERKARQKIEGAVSEIGRLLRSRHWAEGSVLQMVRAD